MEPWVTDATEAMDGAMAVGAAMATDGAMAMSDAVAQRSGCRPPSDVWPLLSDRKCRPRVTVWPLSSMGAGGGVIPPIPKDSLRGSG